MTRSCALFCGVALAACLAVFSGMAFANHAQYYVLDGFGGVHAGGGAPAISPATTYFGFDIAKDIAYIPLGTGAGFGEGIVVLDGFGGVHVGGDLTANAPSPATTYFGFDIARAITYRNIPPRANATSTSTNNTEVTSSTYVVAESTTLTLPDDGYVLIIGNLSMGNNSFTTGEDAQARIAIGVDGTTELDDINRSVHMAAFADAPSFRSEVVAQGAFLTAGEHTFNLLVRKASGPGEVLYFDPTIAAIYIDQNSIGNSLTKPGSNGLTGPILR